MLNRYLALIGRRKAVVTAFVALALAQPVLEVASFSLLYLILSPERYAGVRAAAARLPLVGPELGSLPVPWLLFGATSLVIVLIAAARIGRVRTLSAIKYNIYRSSLLDLTNLVLRAPPGRLSAADRREVATVALHEVGAVSNVLTSGLNVATQALAIGLVALVSLTYSPPLVGVAVALGLLSVALNRRRIMAVRDIGESKFESQKEMLLEVQALLQGLERIKYDALEAPVRARMAGAVDRSHAWKTTKVVKREEINVSSDTFGLFSVLVIVLLGVTLVAVEPATLLVLLILFARLRGYVAGAQGDLVAGRVYWPAAQRSTALMDRLEAIPVEPDADASPPPRLLEARDVGAAYGSVCALDGLRLGLGPGDRVLVRGPSGQGKTTLLRVLSGLLPPTTGRLEVEDAEGRHPLTLARLRSHMVYCSNDLYIFAGTVRQALDLSGVLSDKELWAALDRALLAATFRERPEGLDTVLEEDAQNLSLGQRQRLLLARVFLKDPRILILDEATSHLDAATEEAVLANVLAHLRPDAILVVATHRPLDGRHGFGRVLVVERGRVTETAVATASPARIPDAALALEGPEGVP